MLVCVLLRPLLVSNHCDCDSIQSLSLSFHASSICSATFFCILFLFSTTVILSHLSDLSLISPPSIPFSKPPPCFSFSYLTPPPLQNAYFLLPRFFFLPPHSLILPPKPFLSPHFSNPTTTFSQFLRHSFSNFFTTLHLLRHLHHTSTTPHLHHTSKPLPHLHTFTIHLPHHTTPPPHHTTPHHTSTTPHHHHTISHLHHTTPPPHHITPPPLHHTTPPPHHTTPPPHHHTTPHLHHTKSYHTTPPPHHTTPHHTTSHLHHYTTLHRPHHTSTTPHHPSTTPPHHTTPSPHLHTFTIHPPHHTTVAAVREWTSADVDKWLASIDMDAYADNFSRHEVHGAELLNLKRNDLKVPFYFCF